jgi:hypothetical protein
MRPLPVARPLAATPPVPPSLAVLLAPAVLLLLAAVLLAGCSSVATLRVRGHRLRLTLEEYRILPQTASVPAGPLTIAACNRGILTHNVALQQGSLDSDERTTLTAIPTLLPGRCGSVTTVPLAAGRYLLTSTVGNQAVLGMAATLIVR